MKPVSVVGVAELFCHSPRWSLAFVITLLAASQLYVLGCGTSGQNSPSLVTSTAVTVNSLADTASPPEGQMTLRAAIAQAGSTKTIRFSPELSGETIELSIVGEEHSVLEGELYSGMTFNGYGDRDYGKSALYVRGDLAIDASDLPGGITLHWNGGDSVHARVLAVYGNLTMNRVRITGGYSKADSISDPSQPYTLARGGGLAVWGMAKLTDCAVYGNRIEGDSLATRDRGALGGGIYANALDLNGCVVSGNWAKGYGAAGGGIYSVGGADNTTGDANPASLNRCVITGNRTTGKSSYGGGVFTLAGGPNNIGWMYITNSTIARNLVENNLDLPDVGQYYFRGGGIYLGGGSVQVVSSTVAENAVVGTPATFNNKPNVGGGGIAATIGDAHTVEIILLQESIVAGNTVNGASADVFSGSVLEFFSYGYNRIGTLDFSQILVPIPDWMYLSRKHYPKVGDVDGVALGDVVQLDTIQFDQYILSAGTDSGGHALLWYWPGASSRAQVPISARTIPVVTAGYTGFGVPADDFLNHVVQQVKDDYSATLGADFGDDFGDMTGVTWYESARTWPSDPRNAQWISFWRQMDEKIAGRLGQVALDDDFWGTFHSGYLDSNINLTVTSTDYHPSAVTVDQRNAARSIWKHDIGAIDGLPAN